MKKLIKMFSNDENSKTDFVETALDKEEFCHHGIYNIQC